MSITNVNQGGGEKMRAPLHQTMIMALALAVGQATAGAQTRAAQDQAYVVEYYYKARWGYADEFIRLFRKNHWPILKKQVEAGRMLSVSAVRPRYHTTEDGRWDYRVTIVFKNMAAASDQASEEPIIKQLFPDQETFKREEQRRFEILLAHWDVPVVSVPVDR